MYHINRTALVIKPKERFIEWVNTLPDASDSKYTLEELSNDCQVFLIPDQFNEEDAIEHAKELYEDIFESELWGICTNEDWWPKVRDWKTFQDWFTIEVHTTIVDTTGDPIEQEEM